jgi:hypothetical protein
MCYEHFHICRFCKRSYHCDLENNLCPTINFDADKNLCDDCRKELELLLRAMESVNDNREK